jgi:hypothetical protein
MKPIGEARPMSDLAGIERTIPSEYCLLTTNVSRSTPSGDDID